MSMSIDEILTEALTEVCDSEGEAPWVYVTGYVNEIVESIKDRLAENDLVITAE